MDVREKLVEILKQAPFEGKVLDEWWLEEKIKMIADYFIANGVTERTNCVLTIVHIVEQKCCPSRRKEND